MDAVKLLFGKVTNKALQGNWVKIYIRIYLQDLLFPWSSVDILCYTIYNRIV